MKGLFFKVHAILKERGIKIRFFENERKALKLIRGKEIITNDSEFTTTLLQEAGFRFFHVVDKASLETVEVIKSEMQSIKTKEIVTIGGGKAIDVGKKIAADLGINLISFPTAPSHDGLISRNCSLYDGKKRKTIPSVYPKKLFIPLNLWRNSGNLRKAGICDLISNYVALQDISLAEKKGEKFKSLYKFLSFEATKLINSQKEKYLAYALIFSGLAMEETSRYCSGSEHEVERLIESKLTNTYLHGQLAGTGTLIASRIYAEFKDRFSNLRFDPKKLFGFVVKEMKKNNVLDFAILPLKDPRFRAEWLTEISTIRPERYTLWNKVNSKEVEWNRIIEEIKSLK